MGVPVLVITPVSGEATAEDERFWLQISPQSRQVECAGGPQPGGCADAMVEFVEGLR